MQIGPGEVRNPQKPCVLQGCQYARKTSGKERYDPHGIFLRIFEYFWRGAMTTQNNLLGARKEFLSALANGPELLF